MKISLFTSMACALLVAGTTGVAPAHAGFLDKLQSKIDKVTKPIDDAQRKVDDSVQEAAAPVVKARDKTQGGMDKATAPVRRVQGKVADTQFKMAAMRQKMFSARSLAQNALQGDPALSSYGIRTVVSPDNKALRLVGSVSTLQEKTRAMTLAAKYAPGQVVNDIKVIPATAVANAKTTALRGKTLKRPLR